MGSPSKISEALGIAVHMEQEGQEYYAKAAHIMTHPFVKSMFLSLVKDELRHEQVFRKMALDAGIRPAEMDEMDQEGPIQRIRAVFKQAGEAAAADGENDAEVLRTAMKMEEGAYKFYTETAEATENETEKEILRKIAAEENEHYRILDDTLLYMTDPVKWNLKEENPVIDGG